MSDGVGGVGSSQQDYDTSSTTETQQSTETESTQSTEGAESSTETQGTDSSSTDTDSAGATGTEQAQNDPSQDIDPSLMQNSMMGDAWNSVKDFFGAGDKSSSDDGKADAAGKGSATGAAEGTDDAQGTDSAQGAGSTQGTDDAQGTDAAQAATNAAGVGQTADKTADINKVTQKDGKPVAGGEHSCGAAATTAAINKEKGTQVLQDLNKKLQDEGPYSEKNKQAYEDLDKASKDLPASQAAYNDALQRVMWDRQMATGPEGTKAGTMQGMLDKAGCARPADPSNPQNGESWPAKVNKNLDPKGDAKEGHWVTHGRDQDGKEYFYDPYPGGIDGKRGGKGQVIKEGDADFKKYKAASGNDASKGRGALPGLDGKQ